jgi:glycosyltransferase involved in cell wall biosynthesis
MKEPLVSVIIPVFNVSPFVQESVLSICNQSYRNLEIVIVDDCSTDETFAICKELAINDARIKVHRNQVNSGISHSLSVAFKLSTGAFIARHDGDDISFPERIEKQLDSLVENDLDLIGLQVQMVDEDLNHIKQIHYPGSAMIGLISRFKTPVPHFWLTKRKVYDHLLPYRFNGAEDYDFVLRCINVGYKVSNLNATLYQQRFRIGNTATASLVKQVKSYHAARGSDVNFSDTEYYEYLANMFRTRKVKTWLGSLILSLRWPRFFGTYFINQKIGYFLTWMMKND